jgi:Chlorophyll A-B binding protein
LNYYRAAELKHGRVAMVATLGVIVQGLNTGIIPGASYATETNAFTALRKVYETNPGALLQVG